MEKVFSNNQFENEIQYNIAIAAFPWEAFGPYKFLDELLTILLPLTHSIFLISGNLNRIKIKEEKIHEIDIGITMHYVDKITPKFYSYLLWFAKCIFTQIFMAYYLFRYRKNFNCVIFYMAYPYYLLPLLAAKLLRKATMDVITRSQPKSKNRKLFSIQDSIFFRLLDGISPETNSLIKLNNIEKYYKKILPEGARYIDENRYTIKKSYEHRENYIGYISRLTKEKGIIEFVDAIRNISKQTKNFKYFIIGTGDLLPWILNESQKIKEEFDVNIMVTGYVDEEDIPKYINEMKLLVLPTRHNEGLPTIILEAIFCGTPVLSTAVGAIPEIIKNNKTGFLLEDTDVNTISKRILEIMDKKDLKNIIYAAKEQTEEKFSYSKAVERWKNILLKVC